MALIKNAILYHIRVVPDRPNKRFDPTKPTWELQIRTYDAAQAKEWEAQGVQLKAVIPDDGSKPFWKANLRKRTEKKDGSPAKEVEVKGGNMRDIDPATIGNGSEGHVRLYQYEYQKKTGGTGISNILMGLQVYKLKKYTPKPRDDDFEEQEMEIIEEDDEPTDDEIQGAEGDDEAPAEEESGEEEGAEAEEEEEAKPATPSVKKPSTKKFD